MAAVCHPARSSLDRRAEPDDVAVEIDESALVLSPLRVLGPMHFGPRGAPLGCELAGVVHEDIRGRSRPLLAGGHATEVELEAVSHRETVRRAVVPASGETEL